MFSALCAMGVFFHLAFCLVACLRERLWLELCRHKEENEKNVQLKIATCKIEHNEEMAKKKIENKKGEGVFNIT